MHNCHPSCREEDIQFIVDQTKDRFQRTCHQLFFEQNGIKDRLTEVSSLIWTNEKIRIDISYSLKITLPYLEYKPPLPFCKNMFCIISNLSPPGHLFFDGSFTSQVNFDGLPKPGCLQIDPVHSNTLRFITTAHKIFSSKKLLNNWYLVAFWIEHSFLYVVETILEKQFDNDLSMVRSTHSYGNVFLDLSIVLTRQYENGTRKWNCQYYGTKFKQGWNAYGHTVEWSYSRYWSLQERGHINETNYPYSIISSPPPPTHTCGNLLSKKGGVISSQ